MIRETATTRCRATLFEAAAIHRPRTWRLRLAPAILALLFVAGVTADAQADTYFVATNGDDAGPGTLESPWLTLQHAVGQLNAGDTLYIRGGTYAGAANTIDTSLYHINSGAPGAPITISAYPGGLPDSTVPGPRQGAEVVTILPPGPTTFGIALTLPAGEAPSYMIFEDLIIDGANNTYSDQTAAGVALVFTSGGASFNQFIHLEIRNNGGDGLGFSPDNGASNYNQVLYSLFHDNGCDQTFANAGYGAYTHSDGNLFDGNSFYNNHGYGQQLRGSNNIVRNNAYYNNVINVGGSGVGGASGGGFNMLESSPGAGDGNLFYNNLIYNNGVGAPSGTQHNGVLIYTYESHSNVYNNAIYGNQGIGILTQYYDGSAPPIIEDNVVYGNRDGNMVDAGDYQGAARVAAFSDNTN